MDTATAPLSFVKFCTMKHFQHHSLCVLKLDVTRAERI